MIAAWQSKSIERWFAWLAYGPFKMVSAVLTHTQTDSNAEIEYDNGLYFPYFGV